jgi:hypothetical protein
VLPFFRSQATVDAHLALMQKWVADSDERLGDGGWRDVTVDEELVYLHILRDEPERAEEAAGWVERAAAYRPVPWAIETNARVQKVMAALYRSRDEALAELSRHASLARAALKLPLTDEDQRG